MDNEETNALANKSKIQIKHRKQIKNIQNDHKTSLDVRNTTMGDSSNEPYKQNRDNAS